MMESLRRAGKGTLVLHCRAEATDVANAVLDGCDGIMLGAETLRGKQPVATVDTILHICKQAEMCFDHRHHYYHLMDVSSCSSADTSSSLLSWTPSVLLH